MRVRVHRRRVVVCDLVCIVLLAALFVGEIRWRCLIDLSAQPSAVALLTRWIATLCYSEHTTTYFSVVQRTLTTQH